QIMNSTDIQLNSFCIFCEVAIRQKPRFPLKGKAARTLLGRSDRAASAVRQQTDIRFYRRMADRLLARERTLFAWVRVVFSESTPE
ncbi:MAG: hypothetical protein PUC47_08355, partial [Oscillospiraceae bacterium]|nr:hypothetical protein [Oscillospiraceae bacterium]